MRGKNLCAGKLSARAAVCERFERSVIPHDIMDALSQRERTARCHPFGTETMEGSGGDDVTVGDDSGVTAEEEEEEEEETHGRLPCPRWSRVYEAAAERTVRATRAQFSMTNQARLIDQTYLPRDKAATSGTRADIVRELFGSPSNRARDRYQSCTAFNRTQTIRTCPGWREFDGFRQTNAPTRPYVNSAEFVLRVRVSDEDASTLDISTFPTSSLTRESICWFFPLNLARARRKKESVIFSAPQLGTQTEIIRRILPRV